VASGGIVCDVPLCCQIFSQYTENNKGEHMMLKHILSVLVAGMLVVPSLGWAQDAGFTVAGEVKFSKTGDILMSLVTQSQFENDGDPAFGLLLTISEEGLKANKIAFAFEGVPTGTYAIQAFQDVNGNSELDSGNFGPKEPWGIYRPKRPAFRGPRFDEIKFEVAADMTDIAFEVK
jgi:uncharacterized protein (DUF2141 family)